MRIKKVQQNLLIKSGSSRCDLCHREAVVTDEYSDNYCEHHGIVLGVYDQHYTLIVPEVKICGSTGPRIGGSGTPRCGQDIDHDPPHRGFPGSGFEDVTWGDPLMRDLEFAKNYRPLEDSND